MGQLGVDLPPNPGLPRHQQRLQQRQRAENAQQKRWQEMQQVKEKGKVLQGGEPRIGLWNHGDFMGSWWFLFRDFMGFSLRSWLKPPRILCWTCWKQIFRPGPWGLWTNDNQRTQLHWSLANQWLKAVPFLMSKRRGSHLPFRAFLRGRWMTIMGGNSWRGSGISLKMLTRPVCIVQLPNQSSIT